MQSTTGIMDVKFTAWFLNIPTISTPDILYNSTTANTKTIDSFQVMQYATYINLDLGKKLLLLLIILISIIYY